MDNKGNEKLPLEKIFDIMGSPYAVAKKLNIRPSSIYKWDLARPPRRQCVALAKMSNGAVTKEELRPDIKRWETNSDIIDDLKSKLAVYESVNGYINSHLSDVEKSLRSTIGANEIKLAGMFDGDEKTVQAEINQMLKDRLVSVQAALELTEG